MQTKEKQDKEEERNSLTDWKKRGKMGYDKKKIISTVRETSR